jgi:hypothetical protein
MHGGIVGGDFERALIIEEGFGVVLEDEEFLTFGEVKFCFTELDAGCLFLPAVLFLRCAMISPEAKSAMERIMAQIICSFCAVTLWY